jgi:CheY-like chemotaxis protein
MVYMNQVLLVEDDESHIILARILLERLGFQVKVSNNGEDAINIFSQEPDGFYFVMTDYSMIPMDGLELAEALLKINPAAVVLVCSGRDDPQLIKTARKIGVRKMVLKPTDRLELEDLLINAGLYQPTD